MAFPINKPAGQVVHPGSGTGEDTMVHALLHYAEGELSTAAGATRPGVVHRLDKETSGVILFAKTDETYHALTRAFAEREMRKEYVAIVGGSPRLKSGRIDKPIGRHPQHRVKMAVIPLAREALTDWRIEKNFGPRFTLLRLFPHTGRTHQLRVHLSSIGHPIMGDKLYGFRPKLGDTVEAPRVMLHADKIEFTHPMTGELLTIQAPWPEDFKMLCAELEKIQTI
ncbi:MAG: hypothetical protein B7X06_01205 [Verrucomicrobia bacterium 21-51-4]|nr:MAG: hypothetical protein B7X06_01205 [Verrucomicrobia bacterium 21-51-4]